MRLSNCKRCPFRMPETAAHRLQFQALLVSLYLLFCISAPAFNPPADTSGPVSARIDGPVELSSADGAFPVKLVILNTGNAPLEGKARLRVIDDWTVVPDLSQSFTLGAQAETSLEFSVRPGANSFSAIYPVHALVKATLAGGTIVGLHPVLLVSTTLPQVTTPRPSLPWQATTIDKDSENGLWHTALARVVVLVTGHEPEVMPMGWRGTDPESYASVQAPMRVDRGGARVAVGMHPPWRGGCDGTALFEAPLSLPAQTPIRLRFGVAIRDNDVLHNEPPSDGVTFRVRALPFEAPDGQLGEIFYEQHTTSKRWTDAEVILDRFTGQSIRLQFEVHPGPNNDKTCDQSFWAEPVLTVGTPEPQQQSAAALRQLGTIEREGVRYSVSVRSGSRGLLNAEVHFTSGETDLSFAGFAPQVLGLPLAKHQVLCPLIAVQEESGHGYRIRHSFRSTLGNFDLVGELRIDEGALKAQFQLENEPAPAPWQVVSLEDLAAGPWNSEINRVFAGQGNILVNPKAFSLEFDGHRLSTSYVGFDFANGISILQASDVPPERLEVTPDSHVATLHVPDTQTVCYVPAKSCWQAALIYRDIDKRQAAGGVARAAGRFVFDLWGGTFAEQTENLKRAFQYGLTDAMVVWHNWQHWGYDYRLPEIWPPNPQIGTEAEFRALADLCRQHDVVFAPHDNYIDFYPDADAFSYDDISFTQDGAPTRGWLNEGRGAQAFRWRPDRVRPVLEANLSQIRSGLAPTGFFIDVWSSMGPHAYWTRDGRYFTRTQTRQQWGELFAWIRDYLGDQAPQISESGHDQLIGWLDGAQTNHLRVDAHAKDWTTWPITCADAERIPWMDAVHHDRFVLHGAGYGNRYQGGLDAELHGIYSDDYIVTEAMTGHPAMVDNGFGREVVRMYWLLHDLMRGLASRRIESVAFVDDDIHRQHVRWDNGTEVWVNRGDSDWNVNGHLLPQYGFLAQGDTGDAAIERIDGIITDWSTANDTLYVNARPDNSGRLPISVAAEATKLRNNSFDLTLNWTADRGTDEPMRIFVHFLNEKGAIKFQGDHDSPEATTNWKGTFTTACTVTLPKDARPGDTFDVRAGL